MNTPTHYQAVEGWQVIDVIENYNLNFHEGNALKYVVRCERKGDLVNDLLKASDYLKRLIEYWRHPNYTPNDLSPKELQTLYDNIVEENVFDIDDSNLRDIAYDVITQPKIAISKIRIYLS
jgi:hypothetical protein